MDVSYFLAKVLGLYLLIMSLTLFAKEKKIKVIVKEVISDPALMFMSGSITLMIGVLLVVGHNIWTADWRVLITLIAWIIFIKGIIRVSFPHIAVRMMNKMLKHKTAYYVCGGIALALGIILSLYGFFM